MVPVISEEERMRGAEMRMLRSAIIVERMLNLDTFHEIAEDFRYYEDPSDELKVTFLDILYVDEKYDDMILMVVLPQINDDSVEGSLLPLWTFQFEETSGLEVTGLCWNAKYTDLFGDRN